ncbi:MAG: hypothetical protein AAB438_03970 [Patescibacteria group bacterium]
MPLIVTSNIFLLFPIFVSFFKEEWVFFGIAIGMFVSSVGFHYGYEFYKRSSMTQSFRMLDWLLAMLGTLYVFYFIINSPEDINLKIFLSSLFMMTIVFFWYSYVLQNFKGYRRLHPWFHMFAQITLGLIVLFL